MNQARKTIGLLAVATLVASCDSASESAKAGPDSSAAAQSMADMPGMNMGNSKSADSMSGVVADSGASTSTTATVPPKISLTAAQIGHGAVKWSTVAASQTSGVVQIPGELIPNEDNTARLGAPARGRVMRVLVRPGDRVGAGQTLVTLQSPDAGMAQADVGKATAEVGARRAEAEYAAAARARAERLLTLKAIPRQDYERAIADDQRARAALAQSESEAQRARTTATQLGVGSDANGEIALRAPSAGVVLERAAVPGAVVDAGVPLIVVTNPATLWLSIDAPEPMVGMFRGNSRLRFIVAAYPGDTLSALIESIAAGLDEQTRTLNVRGVVVNGAGRLKPKMLASVFVDGSGSASAIMLPEDAVQMIQGKPFAFVAQPDGKGGAQFTRRAVQLGTRGGGKVAVLSGINAGESVVTIGAFAVKAEFQKATMSKMVM
ncbi:MAG: efflux RND transporter periplasmic adaptor subunit [Phycisphaerae bacterium]|nr:efflux RND transporter periplasmic adaptor subunit [Gemmatimonadaceae bacterium]